MSDEDVPRKTRTGALAKPQLAEEINRHFGRAGSGALARAAGSTKLPAISCCRVVGDYVRSSALARAQ